MRTEKIVYLYVLIVFLAWGVSVFLDKLATNKLGNRTILPLVISSVFSFLVLGIFYFFSARLGYDRKGLIWLTLSSLLNSVALISYYLVVVKTEVSWAVTITALYPIIPIVLGIIILHESLTWTKVTGIVLSLIAIIFLSL